jgi:hypothetical protein
VWLLVEGRRLDVVDHSTARLGDLIDLQAGTRRWWRGGLRQLELERLAQQNRAEPGFSDTERGELWVAAVVFLSRRGAGDRGRFSELIGCDPEFVTDPADETEQEQQSEPAGEAFTTGARWPGDTRTRRRPTDAAGARSTVTVWPFDDVAVSLGEWMEVVSHHWPGITPLNVYELPAYWWSYYVRAARQVVDAAKQQKPRRNRHA